MTDLVSHNTNDTEKENLRNTSHIGANMNTTTKRGSRCKLFGECSSWTRYHFSAFFLTFFSYALFHATRKTFSNVKTTISAEWTPFNTSYPDIYSNNQWNKRHLFRDADDASLFLGTLDTVFMVAYSLGLFISGALGDRFDLRKVLSIGMCSSAVAVFIFGTLSEWLGIYNVGYYIFWWALAGLLQSSGWPTVLAVMGNWFGKSSRGFVLGLWGASPSLGNILGAYTVAYLLHYGYEYAFLVPAAMTFAGGIIVFFGLVTSPAEVGLPETIEEHPESPDEAPLLGENYPNIQDDGRVLIRPDEYTRSRQPSSTSSLPTPIEEKAAPRLKAIGFFRAFLLPGVLPYSLAYACLKLVNYSFFFWLPFYLNNKYHWPEAEADKLSVWYDVGGIVGCVICGYISDHIGTRSPVVGTLLILSPASLFLYNASPADPYINAFLMSVTGFFIGGAANLISTAISADLGRQKALRNNSEALATVTGIIDGTGSVGAALGQTLVPVIMKVGWQYVFYLFMAMTVMTVLCISKIVYHDTRELISQLCRRRRTRHSSTKYDLLDCAPDSPDIVVKSDS